MKYSKGFALFLLFVVVVAATADFAAESKPRQQGHPGKIIGSGHSSGGGRGHGGGGGEEAVTATGNSGSAASGTAKPGGGGHRGGHGKEMGKN